LTARDRSHRRGLLAATRRLSPEDTTIVSDPQRHGMKVPQLRNVPCGGAVPVDDPWPHEQWRFPKVSHQRISSHHRDIGKVRYPDLGMRSRVVRENLHGRTAQGTRVQLEPTPACSATRPSG
jgi:hypothetical protein